MSYKNDSYLVISNKFGSANSEAKAMLFEVYDQIRDLTVSGNNAQGSGFGTAGSFLWQLARLMAPASFMPVMGGNATMNIPGTSYWTEASGATSAVYGGSSAFGIGNIGSYPGFPSGGASDIFWGLGSNGAVTGGAAGIVTGGAAGVTSASSVAGMVGANAAAYGLGTGAGFGFGTNWVLPVAGVISGWGGIMQAAAPYLGQFGLPAIVMGNLMQGTTSAAVAAYQNVSGRIQSNADAILTNKVKNIETVCKMLDTQGDVAKKMLKEGIDSDSKAIQNL